MKKIREWGKTILIVLFLRSFVVCAYEIDGSCMEPQLKNGDRVVVNKVSTFLRSPQRGDIVVFPFPRKPEKDFVKRVVGLPGDVIAIKHGVLLRNGKPLIEPYVPELIAGSFGPRKIPPGQVFVLGDNRNNSFDSRFWGTVPTNNIAGYVLFRFWPLTCLGPV